MWRRAFAIVVATAGLICFGIMPAANAATHEVTIVDNAFSPATMRIEPGDTVRWTATRPGHTLTASDGRFNFHPDRTLTAGEQWSWTFPVAETFKYFCRMHAGMEGVIQVGEPVVEPVAPGPTLIVPDQVPTIAAATAAAAPGTEILIRPGTYRDEEVAVATAGLTLRGMGVGPGAVVLSGGNDLAVGVTIAAPRTRVANLTITEYGRAGIVVDKAAGAVVENSVLSGNGLYGIDARGPAGLTARALHVRGHGVAGIGVRDCEVCGTQIDGSRIEGNAAGVVTVAATGVLVRGSQVRGNAVGIVMRDTTGSQVIANTLAGNASTDVWVASPFDGVEPPNGAGVWINGGRDNVVESNTATGHTYNLVVAGPAPALRHRITGNYVGDATNADLGWDGLGAGVCFSANSAPAGALTTSDPPAAQVAYDCASPTTVGVPYPVVNANMAGHARDAGYPI